jgi:hypothetical protein
MEKSPCPLNDFSSKIACHHKNYKVGASEFFTPRELATFLKKEKVDDSIVVVPVYFAQERQIRLSADSFDPTLDEVSCLMGYSYITKEIAKDRNIEWNVNDIRSLIILELELYENYLNDSIYKYRIFEFDSKSNEYIFAGDSTKSFEGSDFEANGLFASAGLTE